ncbi:MAG: hypothetical protein HY589_00340 [Candidatus Omnitrophica bacterium]|nr:hypothetical protein [Candidatus Omnitrophota bacterium]
MRVVFLLLFLPISVLSADEYIEPPRAMWVWDVKTPSSREATGRLIDFCGAKKINRVYLAAYSFNEENSRNFRQFNQRAHANGIYVHALGGDPRWGLERYHQQPLRWIEEILSFNRASRPAERFDGIQNDTEVYLLGRPWEENKQRILKEYLDLNRKIVELREIEEADIAYACDIPFWYDDDPSITVDWNGAVKPPSFHILDTVDSVTVMDYRNFSDGPNGSIALTRNEIEYAGSVKKKVYIGQETKEGLYPEYITFGGLSEQAMEKQIKKLVEAYINNPGFAGIAIHHYTSYRKLTGKE